MSKVSVQKKIPFHIVFVAALFLFYVVLFLVKKDLIDPDSPLWINYGLQLFQGNLDGFHFIADTPSYSPLVYAPAYPFLIGLVDFLVRSPGLSAYLVSIFSAAILLLTVFHLARRLFGSRIATVALLLCGVYTAMVTFAVSTWARSTAMMFLTLSLTLFLSSLRKKNGISAVLAGLAMGMAVLTRFEFAFYAMLFVAVSVFFVIRRRMSVRNVAYFCLPLVFMYSLYAVPLYIHSGFKVISPYIGEKIVGVPIPDKPDVNSERYQRMNLSLRGVLFNENTALSFNLSKQNRVRVSPEDWEKYGDQAKAAADRKPLFLGNYGHFLRNLLPELIRWHMVAFFLLGTYVCIREKRTSSLILFGLILATFLFFPLGDVSTVRYYAHLLPFLLIIASCGIDYIASVAGRLSGRRWAYPLVLACILAIYFANDIHALKTSFTMQDRVWLESAEYLETHAPEQSIVMARKYYPSYYSGMRMSLLPDEQDLDDVWQYAAHVGVDYVVIDRSLAAELMPQYRGLLEDEIPPFLEVEKELFPGTDYQTRIFRFNRRLFRSRSRTSGEGFLGTGLSLWPAEEAGWKPAVEVGN